MKIGLILIILSTIVTLVVLWLRDLRAHRLWNQAGRPSKYKTWAEYVNDRGCPAGRRQDCDSCACRSECPLASLDNENQGS